jgi:peptidoglycan hydrolase-like protein with peptidoglycan-binding domain
MSTGYVLRKAAALLVILGLSLPASPAPAAKRRPVKRVASALASKKTAARKSTSSTRKRHDRRARPKARQSWRTGQMTPTPERYKEIQAALVEKGFSQQVPDGVWTPEWADALKRFQQDRNLEPTGELNSLSLITLGLGPKRGAETAAPPPPSAPPGSDARTTP